MVGEFSIPNSTNPTDAVFLSFPYPWTLSTRRKESVAKWGTVSRERSALAVGGVAVDECQSHLGAVCNVIDGVRMHAAATQTLATKILHGHHHGPKVKETGILYGMMGADFAIQ